MKRHFIFSLIILALTQSFGEQITESNLYEHSRFWPTRANWIDSPIGGGFPAYLIRINEDNTAILDYGRDGIKYIHVSDTDILARANELAVGEAQKEIPNFIQYTQNMYMRYGGPGQIPAVRTEDLVEKDEFLVLYVNDQTISDEETCHYIIQVEKLFQSAEGQKRELLLIPTDFNFYNRIVDTQLKDLTIMIPHMAIGSLEMLSHQPKGSITAVLLDPNGKVLNRWEALSSENAQDLLKQLIVDFASSED